MSISTEARPRSTAEDQTAEQLIEYFNARHIRSHRAPRRPWLPGPRVVLALATALAALAGVATAAGLRSQDAHNPTFVAAEPLAVADLDPRLTQPPPQLSPDEELERRAAESRADRSHRSAAPATRWVAALTHYRTTSCYGPRWGTTHRGIDMAAPKGTAIRSVGAGVVRQAGWRYRGAGISVVVDHGDGHMTLYAHASRALVRVGQRVAAGTKIALVGATGHVTGPHLHLGLAKTRSLDRLWSTLVNPQPWLRSHGIAVAGCD